MQEAKEENIEEGIEFIHSILINYIIDSVKANKIEDLSKISNKLYMEAYEYTYIYIYKFHSKVVNLTESEIAKELLYNDYRETIQKYTE